MQTSACVLIVSLLVVSANQGVPNDVLPIHCSYESNPDYTRHSERVQAEEGEIQPDGKTIKCPSELNVFCFALWMEDNRNDSNNIVIMKGCWSSSPEAECKQDVCQALKKKDQTFFCCCKGDRCNVNVSNIILPPANVSDTQFHTPGTHYVNGSNYKRETIIIALVPLCILVLIIIIAFLAFRLRLSNRSLNRPHLHLVEARPTTNLDISTLKLSDSIKKGRYSEVLLGTLNDDAVVVKKFAPEHRQYFYNERNIYCLPFMEHENLLKFYGAEEHITDDGSLQYMVILSYLPLGSLKSYLKNATINWNTLCRMSRSFSRGLAHLHMEFKQGDYVKPVIVHRDINTNNILVRSDLSCVVADFGFSMTTLGSKIYRNGQRENAGQFTLADVGTISYMAPEVLEGAVNLRECEASLKQVDIYALGLVLWEVAARCTDLYQGAPIPEHMVPFQAEIGPYPTVEDMHMLVYQNKVRPKFPDVWKDSNQAVRALKETIEDCWDSDAEARLTALCVEERLVEMAQLWANDIRHKGVTPTLNTTGLENIGDKPASPTHVIPSHVSPNPHSVPQEDFSPSEPSENSSAPLLGRNHGESENLQSVNVQRESWFNDRSVSTSTTDTMLLSSSESEPLPPKPHNVNLNKSNLASQPQQGRNPIVERNTHKSSDEELTISGNTLVSSKTSKTTKIDMVTQPLLPTHVSSHQSDSIFDSVVTDTPESSLVQNEHLSPHRNRPIAYQQNAVHGEPLPVRTQATIPNSQLIINHSKTNNNNEHKHKSLFSKLKPREIGLKLSHLAFGKHNKSGLYQPVENKPPIKRCKPAVNLTTTQPAVSRDPRQTEVCILNGVPVVRPTSLSMSNGTLESKDNHRLAQHRLGIAEVGVAKLQTANGGQPPVIRVRNDQTFSQSISDLSPSYVPANQSYDVESAGQIVSRLTTLSVSEQELNRTSSATLLNQSGDSHNLSVDSTDLTPREKIKRRIKTPVGVMRGRFSLCNDRMMSSQSCDDMGTSSQYGGGLTKASISLHQFGSADTDRDFQVSADV